jgi:NAD(P)-dependent dehydrogenase (short-subunit alcohol dehydrogenase family)
VSLHDGNAEPQAALTVADIRHEGGEADTVRAKLGFRDAAHLLAKTVRSMTSRVDLPVFNAGVSSSQAIEDRP